MSIDTTTGIAGLKGALRYVRAYRDHVFVVKLGGEVLSDPDVRDQVAGQLSLLSSLTGRREPSPYCSPGSCNPCRSGPVPSRRKIGR